VIIKIMSCNKFR